MKKTPTLALALGAVLVSSATFAEMRGMRYDRWHNDYTDAVVYKIFMKGKGSRTMGTNLSDAMRIIERIRTWTGGMHQIAYLVGWQFDGHDSKYPSWSEVGPLVSYPGAKTPLEALRQAMRDAKKFNADLSLHVNMNDAYTNAPDWKAYWDAGAICRWTDGTPAKYQVFAGEQSYQVNHIKEWEAGLAQKRIRGLVEMLPELKDSKTIHIDAFFGTQDAFLKTSYKDDEKAIDKCIDLWHELGIDVTTELLFDMDHVGFFPTVYHNNMDERHRLQVRPEVLCGGDQEWCCRDMNWYCFGETWHARAPDGGVVYPEAWGESHWGDLGKRSLEGDGKAFLKGLFTHSLLCRWYNAYSALGHDVDAHTYNVRRAGGVTCSVRIADRSLTIVQNGRTVADGGDMLLDFAEPDGAKLVAYSAKGCSRVFVLPPAMRGVKVFKGLLLPGEKPLELVPEDGKVRVQLGAGEGFCVKGKVGKMDITSLKSKFSGEDPRVPGFTESHLKPPLRVMVIGAHPDDADVRCSGFARTLVEAGHRVRFVALCNGDRGHQFMDSPELARRRFGESRQVIRTLGIEDYIVADTHDCEVQPTLEARRWVTRVIREFAPHLIVTHRPNDYHCDHRATSQLVQDATYLVGVPLWCPETPVPETIPTVFYMADRFTQPTAFKPDFVIDVSKHADVIRRTFACHESQMFEWLVPEHGFSLADVPPVSDVKGRLDFIERSAMHLVRDMRKVFADDVRRAYPDGDPEIVETYQKCEYCRAPVKAERELLEKLGGRWLDGNAASKWTQVK